MFVKWNYISRSCFCCGTVKMCATMMGWLFIHFIHHHHHYSCEERARIIKKDWSETLKQCGNEIASSSQRNRHETEWQSQLCAWVSIATLFLFFCMFIAAEERSVPCLSRVINTGAIHCRIKRNGWAMAGYRRRRRRESANERERCWVWVSARDRNGDGVS